MRRLHRHDWVVYAKPAFGGPMQVLRYLGRYTHRVAISNHRLLAFDQERVTFRWKDYAHGGKQGRMTLAPQSSYGASFCTYFPEGSCASVTSGSSPIAIALPAWHYPDNCYPATPLRLPKRRPAQIPPRLRLSAIAKQAKRRVLRAFFLS